MNTQERNKATFTKLIDEVINTGKLDLSAELLTVDRPDHQELGLPPDLTKGYAGFQRTVGMFREAFPDLRFKSELMIAEGDLVLSNNTITGTHRAPFIGVPPTGKTFRLTALDICRFNEAGKISEHWGVMDMMSLMLQLGAIPPPGGR